MKNYKQLIAVALVLSAAGAVYLLGTGSANTQSVNSSNKPPQTNVSDSTENFPVVSIDSAQNRSIDNARKARNEKFDGSKWVSETLNDNDVSSIRITHWQEGLSPLPGRKSDAVIVGSVTSAQAFLSNDRTGVYSEFSVQTQTVFKNNKLAPINTEQNILIDRAGGRVSYPSGRVFKYSVRGQDMPRLNGRYVFFLTYDEKKSVYLILTAYEIQAGKITALDGKGSNKGSGFDFVNYNGMDEFPFLNAVRDSLREETNNEK